MSSLTDDQRAQYKKEFPTREVDPKLVAYAAHWAPFKELGGPHSVTQEAKLGENNYAALMVGDDNRIEIFLRNGLKIIEFRYEVILAMQKSGNQGWRAEPIATKEKALNIAKQHSHINVVTLFGNPNGPRLSNLTH